MKTTFGASTDVGRQRERNEDNFLVDRALQLHVIADGMGGHAAGAVASATAVNVVREGILEGRQVLEEHGTGLDGAARQRVLALVERTIQRACFQIFARALRTPSERGMGTTLSLTLLAGGRAFIGHVGDSRIYLIRDGAIHQLTEDHSFYTHMVKHGRIRRPDEVPASFRNAVTRAVGIHESVEVDTLDLAVLPGDVLVLTTDGLHGYIDAASIQETVAGAENENAACAALIDQANRLGGADNITAIVLTVQEVDDPDIAGTRRVLDTVRRLSMFRYLDYADLLRVLNIAQERRVARGGTIFGRGDMDRGLYVILEGRVQVRNGNVIIALLEAGQHFGEMSLVDDDPRSADAVAMDDCCLLYVPRRAFFSFMRKNPLLAVKLLWSFIRALTTRLRLTTNELSLVKTLFQSVNPEEVDRLPTAWLHEHEAHEIPVPPRGDAPSGADAGDAGVAATAPAPPPLPAAHGASGRAAGASSPEG